jgi:elongation factor G
MVDDVAEYREKLIETALEQDDEAMEAYLEGEMPSLETIKACIRKGTINLDFFPTFFNLFNNTVEISTQTIQLIH